MTTCHCFWPRMTNNDICDIRLVFCTGVTNMKDFVWYMLRAGKEPTWPVLRIGSCQSGLAHDVKFACGVILWTALVRLFWCVYFWQGCARFPARVQPSAQIKAPMVGKFWAVHSQATSSPHSNRWEWRTRVTPVVDRGDLGGLSPVWYTPV